MQLSQLSSFLQQVIGELQPYEQGGAEQNSSHQAKILTLWDSVTGVLCVSGGSSAQQFAQFANSHLTAKMSQQEERKYFFACKFTFFFLCTVYGSGKSTRI